MHRFDGFKGQTHIPAEREDLPLRAVSDLDKRACTAQPAQFRNSSASTVTTVPIIGVLEWPIGGAFQKLCWA